MHTKRLINKYLFFINTINNTIHANIHNFSNREIMILELELFKYMKLLSKLYALRHIISIR